MLRPQDRAIAGGVEHPVAQGQDQPRLLGNGYKDIRGYQPTLGMLPAHQRFRPHHLPVGDTVARLKMQFQFAVPDREPKVVFQAPALDDPGVHFTCVKAPGIAACGLGLIQRDIGIAQQFGRLACIVWRHGDADAGTDEHFLIAHHHRPFDGFDKALTECFHFLLGTDIGENQHELVTAHPSHQVPVAYAVCQAARYFIKHTVTCRVPEQVIHRFESIQVQAEHHQRLLRRRHGLELAVEELLQACPVG